jgi:hypothetical protein
MKKQIIEIATPVRTNLPPPRKRRGRGPATVPSLPIFSSFEQMSTACGIPVELLHFAKKEGCPFQQSNHRVNSGTFLKWWFDHQLSDKENWTRRDKRACALTREFKLEVARRSFIPWTEADAFISFLAGPLFSGELDRLAQELPPRLKGRNELVIRDELRRQKTEIWGNIKSKLKEWKEKKNQ